MGEVIALPTRYDPYLTKRQLGQHFGWSVRTVERRMLAGMPSIWDGGQRRFRIGDVEAWLQEQEQGGAA